MAFKKVTYNTEKSKAQLGTVEPIRSKEDIQRIINYFTERNWYKYAVIFKFGVYTGLRISDILNLKVYEVRNVTKIAIREQKTGKAKYFVLKPMLAEMLTNYVGDRPDDDWVFEGRQNGRLDRSQVYRRINDCIADLGIDANVGTHTLRKTFGYHHYKQYKDVAILQVIFNHTTPDVTKRYIGITQDEVNETYLGLDLEADPEDLENVDTGNSRLLVRRVESFCSNYLKNGGKKYAPFAKIILEILRSLNGKKTWEKGVSAI